MMLMKRTTIVAEDALLARLRDIARRERVSLATVIREGMEWRAARGDTMPRFIAAGASRGRPKATGRDSSDVPFEPRSWR
jgi:hypothetical protein